MNWIQKLVRGNKDNDGSSSDPHDVQDPQDPQTLEDLRNRFDSFRELVDRNNEVLALIGDMEEKAQGEFLFDIAYVRGCVDKVQSGVSNIIELMIKQGGEEYETLRVRFTSIMSQIYNLLPGQLSQHAGPLTFDFERINRIHSPIVGGKNAQLGEMRSMGLTVPRGFAITVAAFRLFLEENQLNKRIQDTLASLDIRSQEDLVEAGEMLRNLVMTAPLPEVLADMVMKSYRELTETTGVASVALRSSAVGEDTLYSFAGQYSSFLNVPGDKILDRYREILASKYSPRAIYYFLSHSLEEAGLSMSVGCTELVDASVAGVIYSRDPLDPDSDTIHVHAVYGLGPYLVGGVLTPDVYVIRSSTFEVLVKTIHTKTVQLRPDEHGGTVEVEVPEEQRYRPCLTDVQLAELSELAKKLEEYYNNPQDIEFAYNQDGELVVLQSRPLRTISSQPVFELPDMGAVKVLANSGTTVCPGAGTGKVVHVSGRDTLTKVEHGDVVVAANPFPSMVRVLDRAAAVVTEVGSSASHMAALVREKRIPTLAGLTKARQKLAEGAVVTVDATGGIVYEGDHPELLQARRPEYDLFQDTAIFDLLRRLLKLISPLHLVNPSDPKFRAERCLTLHDITRYSHQRSIEDVFKHAHRVGRRREFGTRLKTTLPLPVHLLNLNDPDKSTRKRVYDDNTIPSEPMQIFWNGMMEEKWPFAHPYPKRLEVAREKGGGRPVEQQFTESSFAVVRSDYMLASLRLGYHFTSVEAELGDDPDRNFIRVHYKGGGAADERRRRRISLLEDLLDRMGFEHIVKSDFIDCRAAFLPREQAELNLRRVGRLVILTKQLDMALSNERITRWYIEDFARKLDLEHTRAFPL
jgi:pyruvate, water dikinase